MAAMLCRHAATCTGSVYGFRSRFLQLHQQILHQRLQSFHDGLHGLNKGGQFIEYTIRQGRREDIPGMFQLMSEAGSNLVMDYLQIPFDCFPEGVFVAESLDGEIISQCAANPLDEQTGFMSSYITKEPFQRQGIGSQVFNLSYKALGKRNVGCNSVWDRKEMYNSGIFKIATFNLQVCDFPVKNVLQTKAKKSSSKIVDIIDVDMRLIVAYDKKIHPMHREKVLKWTLGFATAGRVALDGDEIKGWGALCKGSRGYRLMPLYSDTPDVAEDLAHDLLKQVAGKHDAEIEICLPEDNIAAKKLFDNLGAFEVRCKWSKMKRMFTGHDVPVPTHLVYSVMNYEQVLA